MANSDNGNSTGAGAPEQTHHADNARHLDEAILRTMRQPILVLSEDLRVETANRAFYQTFAVEELEIKDCPLYELGNGQWDIPQLRALLEDILPNNGTIDDYRVEHEFEQIGRRVIVLNANRIVQPGQRDMILLAIDDITAHEEALALLESEKQYIEKIVDSSRDALLILDLDLRVKSANETFCNTFGVTPSAIIGRPVYELGNGQWNIPQLRDLLEQVLPDNDTFDNFEIEHNFAGIGHRIMMLNARRVDHLQLILLAIEDQTAARRADQAFRESELLRRVLDNLFAFVGLLSPDGTVIEANRAPLEAAGIKLADVRGRQFEDCYWWSHSPDVQADLREAIGRAASGETVRYDAEVQVVGGRLITIDFMLAPMRGEDDVIIGLIASAVDITERKRLTEERFQAFLDVSPDALILINADGTIGSVSIEVERLFGYSREELIGRRVEWLMPQRDRAPHMDHQESYFANPRRRLIGTDLEIYGLSKDGREIPLEVGLSPMVMPDGIMALAAVRDITQRKQAEQALQLAKEEAVSANALKSRFIAAASHDLRQPLQTMALLGGVLAKTVKDEASRSAVEQLRETSEAMGDIIGSLLDIDQLDSGRMEPNITTFPIQRLLNRLRSQFTYVAMERGIELRMVSSSAITRSDPRLLERLVGNLVSNAIKYTESGGRVLIGCRWRRSNLRIEVWDTGIGIPKDQLDGVFDEYRRLAPTGNREPVFGVGLGLTIVKRLSELLQHQIEVCSALGQGSMFSVEVPLVHTINSGRERLHSRSGNISSTGRPQISVLLVEDEAGPRESLRQLLELNGYEVRAFATAHEALDLEGYPFPPRLVIADNQLGVSMTGLQVIQSLREMTGWDFPAIVMTGDSSSQTREAIESAGCRYEAKPVNANHLLNVIGDLVGYGAGTASSTPPLELPVPPATPEAGPSSGQTIFVVEDESEVRMSIRSLLTASGHHVEEFATAESFLEACAGEARRGCVLVDVGLPGMSGLEMHERLKADGINLPVLVVTGRHDVSLAVQAMRAGAVDFLEKPFAPDRLLQAVTRALTHSLPDAGVAEQPESVEITENPFACLTPREHEVLGLVADGQLNKEVAFRLGLSQRTVENYRARAMQKTGIRSLAELVRLALAAETAGFKIFPR
ncbi:MAG: PAS domain S-box protein [Oceanicaulis sp.]|nr:PAS domain S-box protein [Oceanicaulis sp.]